MSSKYVSPRFEDVVRKMPLDGVSLEDFIQEKLEGFALEMDSREVVDEQRNCKGETIV